MTGVGKKIFRSQGFRRFIHGVEEKVPVVRDWHRFAYALHFEEATPKARMFSGVYSNLEAALADAPKALEIGHDHAKLASRHKSEVGHIWPSDYPVLFWLRRLLPGSASIFDLGGNVGHHYYGFQRYLTYPDLLRWVVSEVPAVAEAGRAMAAEKGVRGLEFTTGCEAADGSDILLASGVLPFLDVPLGESLSHLSRRPKHVLVNRTAIWDGPAFLTLHNLGMAVCPYRILNRPKFVASMAAAGYELEDSWENPEFSCYIPFHADRTVRSYSGFYFRLTSTGEMQQSVK